LLQLSQIHERLFSISPLHRTHWRFDARIDSLVQAGQNIVVMLIMQHYYKEPAMFQYIPFIHKIIKKEKKQQEQVSLYIDNTIPERIKIVAEEKETEQTIVVIDLL